MSRVDFHDLADKLANPKGFTGGVHIVLCDDALLPYLIKRTLAPAIGSVKTFDGKQAVTDFVDDISQGSLFSEPHANLVFLAERYTENQWNAVVTELSRLPSPADVLPSFLVGSAGLRNTVKEPALKGVVSSISLAYQPSEMEAAKTMRVLLKSYPKLSDLYKASDAQQHLINAVAVHYGTDFTAAALHFERMEKGGLGFEEAVLNQTEADSFQVIDALIRFDSEGLYLRLSQCQASGLEAAAIFGSATYFFKQLLSVHALMESGLNLKQAFDTGRIPYPAQARLQAAIKRLSVDKVLRYFRCAATLELSLRKAKNPFDLLAIELAALIA